MTKLNEKTLSQMLEEIEPPFVQSKLLKESAWVDRTSYDKLKQVAILLSKRLEKFCTCYVKPVGQNISEEVMCANCIDLSRAKDIVGGKGE